MQALTLYALNCVAVFVTAFVLGLFGPGPGGLPFLAAPVAIYASIGKVRQGVGLIVCAIAGAACVETVVTTPPGLFSPWNAALVACMAGSGVILAQGIARCWSYGALAIAMTAPVFITQAVNVVARWHVLQTWFNASVESLRAALQSPMGQPPDEAAQALLELSRWLSEHWSSLILGSMFGTALVGACIAISFTSMWLRRVLRRPGSVSGFRAFGVPDWLAWAVILTAVLAYVDYRWPNPPVRMAAWNLGLALGVTYWLNGLSVLTYAVYAAERMNVRAGGYLAAVATLLFFPQALTPFGLFDTWFSFRAKLDKLIEAKRLLDESRNNDE